MRHAARRGVGEEDWPREPAPFPRAVAVASTSARLSQCRISESSRTPAVELRTHICLPAMAARALDVSVDAKAFIRVLLLLVDEFFFFLWDDFFFAVGPEATEASSGLSAMVLTTRPSPANPCP